MIDALRYEWVRISTIRSTWWLSGIALACGIGLSFLAGFGTSTAFNDISNPPTETMVRELAPGILNQFAAFGVPYFVVYILAMLGVFAWGHEYRHGMIRATLTTLSSRTSAWVAKYVIVALWVLSVTLLVMLGSALSGWFWLRDNGVDFTTAAAASTIGRTLLYTLLFTWIATAFTSLIRNQTAAMVLLFIWPLAAESVVTLVFSLVPGLREHSELTRFLPFNAGGRILYEFDPDAGAFGDPLSVLGGAIIFGGVAAVLMIASFQLFSKRDA